MANFFFFWERPLKNWKNGPLVFFWARPFFQKGAVFWLPICPPFFFPFFLHSLNISWFNLKFFVNRVHIINVIPHRRVPSRTYHVSPIVWVLSFTYINGINFSTSLRPVPLIWVRMRMRMRMKKSFLWSQKKSLISLKLRTHIVCNK